MDNEKYTVSLIDSIEAFILGLQYLGKNNRTTVRALSTYKILHWLYSWADWYQISEANKIKLEQLMNCLILRNSSITLPVIQPQLFYTNVNSPQNLWTWRILEQNTSHTIIPTLTGPVLSLSSNVPASVTVSYPEIHTVNITSTPTLIQFPVQIEPDLVTIEFTLVTPSLYLFEKLIVNGDADNWPQATLQFSDDPPLNSVIQAIYRTPTPPVKSIHVTKIVQDSNGSSIESSEEFTVTLSSGSWALQKTVTVNSPAVFASLEYGTYTITEEEKDEYTIVGTNPQTVVIGAASDETTFITFTNRQQSGAPTEGTVTINKHVLPSGAGASTIFHVEIHDVDAQEDVPIYKTVLEDLPTEFTLPFGNYTLQEVSIPSGFNFYGIYPAPEGDDPTLLTFTLDADNLTIDIWITNQSDNYIT